MDAPSNAPATVQTGRSPSLGAAIERVVDSSQQLISHQLELLRAETKEFLRERAVAGALLGTAALFALIGWLALMGALIQWIGPVLTYALAVTIVGAAHLLVGIALALVGFRRLRQSRPPIH